jgi:hypothetical protein
MVDSRRAVYSLVGGWGPLIWATLRETTDSYNMAALVSIVCHVIGVVALLFLRPMKK